MGPPSGLASLVSVDLTWTKLWSKGKIPGIAADAVQHTLTIAIFIRHTILPLREKSVCNVVVEHYIVIVRSQNFVTTVTNALNEALRMGYPPTCFLGSGFC